MSVSVAAREASEAVDESEILEVVRTMVATPSPSGDELLVAERLADVGRELAPGLGWHVDPFDESRANLLVTSGTGRYSDVDLLLFAHLDTSLSGPDEYRRLTGGERSGVADAGQLVIDRGRLVGPGEVVAKGPAAGAVGAMLAAQRSSHLDRGVGLLLTSGGTHRAAPGSVGFACGLRRAMTSGLSPQAAINVKAGAPGVLHEEPGSAYVRVSVWAPGGPAMLRRGDDDAGAAVALSRLTELVERWRSDLRARSTASSCGREAAVGAITTGLSDKPDLLPSFGWADIYLVTAPEDQIDELVEELTALIDASAIAAEVVVAVTAAMPGGSTDPAHRVVQEARAAWERHFGPHAPISDWRGSTDGALLRSVGIPVARLGPRPRTAPPGLEALDLLELVTFARIDAELIAELSGHVVTQAAP